LAFDHVFSRTDDEIDLVLWQMLKLEIGQRRAFLQLTEGSNDRPPPTMPLDPNDEIEPRALGLRAPQMLGRHRHLAERVFLSPPVSVARCARHDVSSPEQSLCEDEPTKARRRRSCSDR